MKEEFFQVCALAEPAQAHYVSLYRVESYYGGPEEGGWWGRDYTLVAFQVMPSEEAARQAREQVKALAERATTEAADRFRLGCAAEQAWLDARRLDSDFLPEVSGPDRYEVLVESRPGEHASEGSRTYS